MRKYLSLLFVYTIYQVKRKQAL